MRRFVVRTGGHRAGATSPPGPGMSGFTGVGYPKEVEDYVDRAVSAAFGRHTPHLLEEALSWHACYVRAGSMMPQI